MYFIVALLGVVIGSFVTAFIARYGVKTMARGRSACGTCGTTLASHDLIPILSYLLQKGRCRYCESRIPLTYLFTEIITALIFLSVFHTIYTAYGLTVSSSILFILYASAFTALLALSLYDLKHFIIPDNLVMAFIIGGYGARIYELLLIHQEITYLHLLSGPLLALPLLAIWLLSRGTWIGFGDVKLAVGIGGILGLISGVSAVILGVWIGAGVSLLVMLMSRVSFPSRKRVKQLTMKSEVPFGPYLALGTILSYLYFPDVLGLAAFL